MRLRREFCCLGALLSKTCKRLKDLTAFIPQIFKHCQELRTVTGFIPLFLSKNLFDRQNLLYFRFSSW